MKELHGHILDLGSGCFLGDKIFSKPDLNVLPLIMTMNKEFIAYALDLAKLSSMFFEEFCAMVNKERNKGPAPVFKDIYPYVELKLN